MGQALANYVKFEKRGFKVVGFFDINPVFKGISIRGNEIRMMDELPEFLRENEKERKRKNNWGNTNEWKVR